MGPSAFEPRCNGTVHMSHFGDNRAMEKRRSIIISAVAVAAMCAFVFFMSDRPSGESGAMSAAVTQFFIQLFVPDFSQMDAESQKALMDSLHHAVRKLAHFSEYAVLGMLAVNLARRIRDLHGAPSPRVCALAAWACSTLYAVTDEIHQIFVPGRACLATDVLIDSAGVATGILIFLAVVALRRRRNREHLSQTSVPWQ